MNLAAIPHDLQVSLQIATAAVILGLQGVNLWRSISNGKGIQRAHHGIAHLDESTAGIEKEMVIVRQSLTRMQAHLDGRATYGRRAGDAPGGRRATDPAPMRSAPIVEGMSPRSSFGGAS